jgi:hypothetical protein
MSDAIVEAEEFIATTTYVVSASLLSPHGRVIGRLERNWQGAFTIGDLAMKLITNSQERTDLDQCKIEVRWRKTTKATE